MIFTPPAWKVAIKRLKGIRDNYEDTLYWAAEMAQMVRDIYGDDSIQHRETYHYYNTYISAKSLRTDNGKFIIEFLSAMIATIERDRYINQPPKGNYLSRLDNQTVTWILGILCVGSFFVGKYATEIDMLKQNSVTTTNSTSNVSNDNTTKKTHQTNRVDTHILNNKNNVKIDSSKI